ncbi:VanZ family protein [Shewanella youngdeokensis]|uniref:VanZ family protein n=1 Tax=Shewanella youngdeokensis TaxID=2999068 RepID=A0ABZ0K256_9GAMM|nr:VanZ family protein [Shewanella sp. DAU334]
MINRRSIFKVALAITLMVVTYLVFSKPNYSVNTFAHFDKVGHLGSFFVLSYLTYFAFKPRWYVLAIVLTIYAIFIEMVQSQLSYRSASLADIIADMVGVLLFYFTQWLYRKYFIAAQCKRRHNAGRK